MKIEADLRIVINACEKAQNKDRYSYRDRNQATRKCVEALIKKNAKVRATYARYEKAEKASDAARVDLEKFGLCSNKNNIDDKTLFKKAGGLMPVFDGEPWKASTVIAELAAAEPKDKVKILAKFGIKWK